MKPDFAIIRRETVGDYTQIAIDTTKASVMGVPWRTLGDYGKRKFENLLILSSPRERMRISYV